jgi:D-alanine-D-alanine ligase
MPEQDRIRLVVLFGGRSAEHEVSCTSAFNVLAAADRDRYDVVPIGITREGRWVSAADAIAAGGTAPTRALPSPDGVPASAEVEPLPTVRGERVVVLPLVHGPMGEDGTVQGLLELAGVPYVGAGVAASAVCMDKGLAKAILAATGLPQCRYLDRRAHELDDVDALAAEIEAAFGWPAFVKPANLGSSVGVTKVHDAGELAAGIEEALRYDEYIVIEEGIAGREIEVAVLGGTEPQASGAGEIVPSAEFYDYDDKYVTDGAQLLIPAPLSPEQTAEVRALAVRVFEVLRGDGLARVDFFFEEGGRGFLCNEANTMPGFTPISMYPKLWQAAGVGYPELIDRLVELAIERHARRRRNTKH